MAIRQITCRQCAAQIKVSKGWKNGRFCSVSCRDKHYRQRSGIEPRWPDGIPACHKTHVCRWCEVEFQPKRAGRTTFCCVECSVEWRAAVARVTKRAVYRVRVRRPAEKPTPVRLCRTCNEVPIGKGKQRCDSCKQVASAETRRRNREKMKASGMLRAYRKARKLRLRGVTVDLVNPLTVLERDKWRCQLCGIKTPRRLRGTYEPNAPEVDHILPISQGGEHSYTNVQCACRQCNIAKAGKPLGQTLLFG